MKIKVLKTTIASKDPTGSYSFEYKKGKEYEIYDKLAEIFIQNEWGEDVNEKPIIEAPDIQITLEDNETNIQNEAITNKNKKNKKI